MIDVKRFRDGKGDYCEMYGASGSRFISMKIR